ncbi:MAG: hypothetical protein GEU91_18515 [Rhizobiales bacterium]|nr:hypothetical protein [Hyphomicrobiales bacterium]
MVWFPLRLDVDPVPAGSTALIDLALIKQHVRVDHDDEDELLEMYAAAAISWAEGDTHRTIFQRAHRWIIKDFPHFHRMDIRLPRGKTQSVESIAYVRGGQAGTLIGSSSGSPAGTDYQEDLRSESGGVLMPPQGGSWPSVDCDVPAPVTVNFTAGWASVDVPKDLLHAILFWIADAYDLRGTPDFNPAMLNTSGPRFAAREALVSSWRMTRWY